MGAKKRIKVFDLYLGSVYRVKTDFFVYRVQSEINYLTQATSTLLSAGEFYYNPVDGYLYVRTSGYIHLFHNKQSQFLNFWPILIVRAFINRTYLVQNAFSTYLVHY